MTAGLRLRGAPCKRSHISAGVLDHRHRVCVCVCVCVCVSPLRPQPLGPLSGPWYHTTAAERGTICSIWRATDPRNGMAGAGEQSRSHNNSNPGILFPGWRADQEANNVDNLLFRNRTMAPPTDTLLVP